MMESLSFQALVLSNHPSVRPVLTEILATEKTKADFVKTVDKALQSINKNHYDVILGEITLDKAATNGVELLKAIRKSDPDLPMVLMGDPHSIANSIQVINYGVSGFLSIPIDKAQAQETIDRAIRHHKSRFQKNELVNYQMNNHYQVVIKSSEQSSLKLIDTVDNLIELVYPEEYGSFPDLKMAIYEGLTNAVDHGNCKDALKNIYFQIHLKMDRILVQIKDEGSGFEAESTLRAGGDELHRGLALIDHLMDAVTFNHKGNEINFLKLLQQDSQLNLEHRRA